MNVRMLRASWPSPVSDIDVPAVLLAAVRLFDPFALDPGSAQILAMGDETIDGRESAWLDISITV